MLSLNVNHLSDEEFWKSSSENCPETRIEIARRQTQQKSSRSTGESSKTKCERTLRLFNKEGKPLNVNQAKLDFKFVDDNPEMFVLDIALYKYLDSNLIQVDLQPLYVKVIIKGEFIKYKSFHKNE